MAEYFGDNLKLLCSHYRSIAEVCRKLAINRAQFALKSYPEAPATEEALFIMVKAYDLLGMNDLRDDSERIMRKNYPNSVYYTRGLERKEPWWKLW